MTFLCMLFTAYAFATDYYVSPTGVATNDGLSTSKPKTLAAAALIATTGDKVYLMAGTYRETAEIKKDGATFMPAPGVSASSVIINGADAMTSWTQASGSTYSTTMSWDLGNDSGTKKWGSNQLFQDGKMIELARWPKRPATSVDADLVLMTYNAKAEGTSFSGNNITITDDQFNEPAARWVGAKIWVNLARYGSDIDGQGFTGVVSAISGNTITFDFGATPQASNAPWGTGPGTEYFLFDPSVDAVTTAADVDALLAPGEWWKSGTTLYVKTRTEAVPASSATATSNLIEAKRRHFGFWPETANHYGYTIQDLTFFACALSTDRNFKTDQVVTAVRDITLQRLTFKYPSHITNFNRGVDYNNGHLAFTGVVINGKNVVIQDCDFSLASGSALSVQGLNNKVLRNTFHENNYLCASSGVLNTGFVLMDSEIGNNKIYNTTHQGINMRGIANSSRTVKHQSRIHHNEIYDFMMRSYDSGAIDAGVHDFGGWIRIDHNLIYNTRSEARGGRRYGIYIDYGGQGNQDFNHAGATIDHNVIYDVNNPITLNAVWDVHVFNNVLLTVTGGSANNVEGTKGLTLGFDIGGTNAGTNARAHNNIISDVPPTRGSNPTTYIFNNITDANGAVLDELFVNAAAHDYHLKSTATRAIDKGISVAEFTNNYTDNEAISGITDIGAYETSGSSISDTQAPSKPASSSFVITDKTSTNFLLSWTAPADNVGVAYYEVYANNVLVTQTPATSSPSFKLTGLEGSTTYVVKVLAVDGSGNRSELSDALEVKTSNPVPNVDIAKTTATISIDGTKETAWGTATNAVAKLMSNKDIVAPTSAADLSGNWTALWDATNLYVYIDANDDIKKNDSGTDWYWDDHIELYIDADGSKPVGKYNEKQFQYYLGRGGSFGESKHNATSLAGTSAKWLDKTDGTAGYTVEIKIPFSSLGITAQALSVMGIEVQIGDDDDGGREDSRLEWFNTSDNLHNDPSLFGVAKLTADGIADDTTPPSAPTGLTSSSIYPDQFTVSWNAATDNLGVYSYEVYVDGVLVGTPKLTTFTVKNLKEGTTYSVQIKAKDRFFNLSALSSTLKIGTPLKASAVKYESETFSTTLHSANVATKIAGFSGDGYVEGIDVNTSGGDITYTVNAPAAGTYSAFMQYNGKGVVSLYINGTKVINVDFMQEPYLNTWNNMYGKFSLPLVKGDNAVMFKFDGSAGGNNGGPLQDYIGVYFPALPFQAPAAPTALNATSITNNSFTLNWTASTDATVTGYDVYKNGTLVGSTTTGLSLNIPSLLSGTTYDMTVKAKNSQGNESDPSTVLTVLTTGTGSTLVSTIAISPETNQISVGSTVQLYANILPTAANNKLINWTSSNDIIATVDNTGKVTAKNTGTAIITATARDGSNKTGTAQVTVTRPWVKVDDNAVNSNIVYDANWKALTNNDGYLNTNHYMIDSKLLSEATFTFTGTRVKYYGIERYDLGIADVYVDGAKKATVDLFGNNGTKVVDKMLYDSGELLSGSHTIMIKATNMANPNALNKDSNGNPRPGIVIDAFEYSGYSALSAPVTAVNLTSSSTSVAEGGQLTLSATVSPSDASQEVTWSSTATTIATVSNGIVTGVKAGTATIRATSVADNTKFKDQSITVTGGGTTSTPVTSVTVTAAGSATSVAVGSTLQLSKAVAPSNATTQTVTWSSSNTTFATVDANGLVTAKAAGNVTITATADNGVKGDYALTVSAASATLRDADNPSGTVAGLDYSYYEGTWSALPDFSSLSAVKTGTVTNVDLTPRNRDDNFGFKFTGYINVPTDGTYTFYDTSDDGSKISIGTTEVVNNDGLHDAGTEKSGTIGLKAGKHAVTITFFEAGGGESLSLSYSGPGLTKTAIPASAWYGVGTPSSTTLRAADNPSSTVAGLDYSYYEGSWSTLPDFSSLTAIKTGSVTNIDLTPRNRDDNFGFKYTGYVNVPSDGTYTFYTTSDDGSKLLIGSTEVVNNDGLHGSQEKSGTIGLKAGKHAITVTFFEAGGGEELSVSYSGPGVTKQAIPASAWYGVGTPSSTTLRAADNPSSTVAGLDYSYYEGTWSTLPDFSSLTAVKTGTVTNVDLTPRNKDDNFGFKYTGYVNVPSDGTYTFYTSSDDGSKLLIGSTEVVNNDGLHGSQEKSGTIGLKAGKHAITITFFEATGGQELSVSYSGPGVTKTAIPASEFFRVSSTTATASIDRTDAGGTPSAKGQINTTEGAPKAFDNDFKLTKWLDLVATNTWIQFTFANSAKYAVDKYTITCGNDVPGRDPKTWRLLGTNATNPTASDFTEVHSVTDYSFGLTRNQTKEFIPTSKSTAYATYRLEIIANNDATTGKTQLNEIELFAPGSSSTTASVKEGQQLQLNQNTVSEKITVFPNPVTDGWLTVGLTAADKNNKVDVSLSDLSGRIVYKSNFTSNGISERLNIGNVQPGIYVIRITGSNTKFSAKIVVQ